MILSIKAARNSTGLPGLRIRPSAWYNRAYCSARLKTLDLGPMGTSGAELQPIVASLTPQQEMFAGFAATGISHREAARRAGFHECTAYKLMQNPEVRQRVNELIEAQKREDISGIATKSWLESRLISIANALAAGGITKDTRADLLAETTVLMHLAKLKGFVVERSAHLNANVKTHSDRESLEAMLDALEPGARARIARAMEIADTLDVDQSGATRPCADK